MHFLRQEINLSIQYLLNCGTDTAGSCHGGSHSGVYEFIKLESGFVPFDSCMPYIACSSESNEGICKYVNTTCNPMNICRTCDTFTGMGGTCVEIDQFPNATGENIILLYEHKNTIGMIYKRQNL